MVDICLSGKNAARAFEEQDSIFRRLISSMSQQIKKILVMLVKQLRSY
jgi:hypothetical protein